MHCHTQATKEGDGTGRIVSPTAFAEKTKLAEVKITAITNHNNFDLEHYETLVSSSTDICQVWPGIELDMEGDDNDWHLLLVCNPKEATQFSDVVTKLVGAIPPDDVRLSIEQVVAACDSLDLLYVPHAHGKRSGHEKRGIPEKEKHLLESLVANKKRIIYEPHHHSLGVLSRNGYRVILGSDVKDWNDYENCNIADLRFPIASFDAFCKLVEGDPEVYNACVLNEGSCTSMQVKPVEDAVERTLSIYKGVNIIFGQKGTGKSKLIEAMASVLEDRGLESKLYKSSEAREIYDKELIPDRAKCLAETVGADSCADEFSDMVEWSEMAITPFENYVKYYQGEAATKNRTRLVIADKGRSETFTNEDSLKQIVKDKKHIEKAILEINKVDLGDYLDSETSEAIENGLQALLENVKQRIRKLLIDKYAVELLNTSIKSIKKHAERLCSAPSAPDGTGFLEYAKNRLYLKNTCKTILENIDGQESKEHSDYGYLEDKGLIKMETHYLMFKKGGANPSDYFAGKKTALTDIRSRIQKLDDEAFSSAVTEKLTELVSALQDKGISSVDDFVGVLNRTIAGEDNTPYEPSDGELAIIIMKRFLGESQDYYFLDEPERGMGNSYIDTEIRKLIIALAERGKTVVMATHNANLAVRTMPIYSMLTEYHNKNDYAIYAGSPYSNVLTSMDDIGDKREWTHESMKILEGGEIAFYDRKDMYELS